MENLTKLEFAGLDISGNNYISWALDAELHLEAKGLAHTITEGNNASNQDRATALIFLRHHLHDDLKREYLTVKDPFTLWNCLKKWFDHLKLVILPKARMIEQNNELLLRNHEARPVGSMAMPEAHTATSFGRGNNHGNKGKGGYGKGNQRGGHKNERGKGTRYQPYQGKGTRYQPYQGKCTRYQPYQRPLKIAEPKEPKQEKGKGSSSQPPQKDVCYRCGLTDHWQRTCRTPEHFVKLYQASLKRPAENIETNLIEASAPSTNNTHLDVSDYLVDPEGGEPSQFSFDEL
ncbi:uncharacterized protein LOC113336780 [Papaver somniferum]|uniref:uncharacterized protein LOC113336780 n=1 Tax=Papaver somniferum TaxID=3469 RepID=UPI000E704054|nr:uncharacterized protein LOC113336780 [Papaver somniferum]